MKLTLEQFETQWTESNLSTTDWFDTTYGLFKDHEAQLKTKDEEIAKYQMAIDKQSKRAEALKQLSLDKDEEIKKLKAEKESLCKTIKDLQTANTHWRIYHKDNQ